MKSKAIAVWFICVIGASARAQDGSSDDEDPIEGTASLGYLATSGNTDSTNLSASFNLVYSGMIWSHEFDLSTVSADTDGVTTAEAHTAGYTGRRAFGERSYLFTALNWQKDRFSAYDQQVSETVGYGRRFISTDAHELNAEFGVGARQADLRDMTSKDEGIWRSALDYEWTINETTGFSQKLAIESGSSNTSLESISELRARLFGDFAIVLGYRIRRNSDVLPGTEKTDRFTTLSIEYAF